jgi:hypothetical protein
MTEPIAAIPAIQMGRDQKAWVRLEDCNGLALSARCARAVQGISKFEQYAGYARFICAGLRPDCPVWLLQIVWPEEVIGQNFA